VAKKQVIEIVDDSLRVTHHGEEKKLIFESGKGKQEIFLYQLNFIPTHMLSSGDLVDIEIVRQSTNQRFQLKGKFPSILGCYLKEDLNAVPRTVFRFAFDMIYQYHIEKQTLNNDGLAGPKKKKPIIVPDSVLETIFKKWRITKEGCSPSFFIFSLDFFKKINYNIYNIKY